MIENSYEEILEFLEKIPQFTETNGFTRVRALLAEMGHPERMLSVIHVAGSNGKGSVCAYLNQILTAQGYCTGLFTSPHLTEVRERIRIDNALVSKEAFVSGFQCVQAAARRLEHQGIRLAYFDYFVGIAFFIFAERQVDFVILETGIGGKLDATNAVEAPLLSVITTISLEHTAVLGDTIEKIAAEKAGIIKPFVPLVYSAKNREVIKIIEETAEKQHAGAITAVMPKDYQILKNTGNRIDFSLHNGYYKNDCFSLTTGAVYQAENCSLALTAAGVLQKTGKIQLDEGKVRQAVSDTHWEGRMEEVLPGVYLDGAHNPEGIESFIQSAEAVCAGKSAALLFSVVKDKNFEKMIERLTASGIFDSYIVAQMHTDRHLAGESIRDIFKKYTQAPLYEFNEAADALRWGLQKQRENPQQILMCTGSLYLVGELKSMVAEL